MRRRRLNRSQQQSAILTCGAEPADNRAIVSRPVVNLGLFSLRRVNRPVVLWRVFSSLLVNGLLVR